MKTGRSPLECRLYMELHPCDCGGVVSDITERVVRRDETLCTRYTGRCADCARDLEYLFALGSEIVAPDAFGGREPSTIVDAGEYMAAADRAAKQVPADLSDVDRVSARASLARAIACVDEILKWIPNGEDAVPITAFFTDDGQRIRDEEPGRFRRPRLLALRATYREMLIRME